MQRLEKVLGVSKLKIKENRGRKRTRSYHRIQRTVTPIENVSNILHWASLIYKKYQNRNSFSSYYIDKTTVPACKSNRLLNSLILVICETQAVRLF